MKRSHGNPISEKKRKIDLIKYDAENPPIKSPCLISKNSMIFYVIMCYLPHKKLMSAQRINQRFYRILVPFAMQEAYMLTGMPKRGLHCFPTRGFQQLES